MKNQITYQFFYQCQSEQGAEHEPEEIVLTVKDLPFVPQKGMVLCLTDAMEFSVVDEIFWSFDEPLLMMVHFADPFVLPLLDLMLADGWRRTSDVS